ncbi:hypothetical protein SAMN05216203_1529 [Marinobacter daqiaonensis]|uniref:Uncharacterized protein n=1 Tax=Marinobacter daqiaonensis TaxID=650891 RepID=A0A1I6HTF8_9GAMM|nr:hypothetical protein [Marinobacter daqiaonensis]SFR57713.1 hypothetical protein SAMN05216203_1529 [Marinobacter daqiaonensis]
MSLTVWLTFLVAQFLVAGAPHDQKRRSRIFGGLFVAAATALASFRSA